MVSDTARSFNYCILKDSDINILEDEGEDDRSELVVLDPMHVRIIFCTCLLEKQLCQVNLMY